MRTNVSMTHRLTLLTVGLLAAGAAQAQNTTSERQPLSFAMRPLTLPSMTIRGDGALGITHVSIPSVTVSGITVGGGSSNQLSLGLGGGFGITDDFEVGASLLNFTGGDGGGIGDPSFYGMFRFMRGPVELGGRLRLSVPLAEGSKYLTFELGVPALFRVGDQGRFDTGAFVALTTSSPLGKALRLPLSYSHNINPNIFVGGRTALSIPDFNMDLVSVPLGLFGGYSLGATAARGVLADLVLSFDFPNFAQGHGDTINLNIWQLVFSARVFYFL